MSPYGNAAAFETARPTLLDPWRILNVDYDYRLLGYDAIVLVIL